MEPTYPSASEGTGTKIRGALPRDVVLSGTLLLAVKLLQEELTYPAAVGVATGRLHHLTD
jgi:hypothetical protein